MLRVGLSRAPALARLVAMRRKKLQCIRAFVRELDAATRTEYSRQVRETRLVRAYHRLPADVQGVVADGYRQCLMASEDDAGAARQAVLNDLVRGTGLTREQILALPPGPDEAGRARALDVAGDVVADALAEAFESARRRGPGRPDSLPVATAVAMTESPSRRRDRRRWLAYSLAASTAMACAGFALAWTWSSSASQRLATPVAEDSVPVDRVHEDDDGLLLFFSQSELDGATRWLHAIEINLSDEPRPAVDAVIETGARDRDGEGHGAERVLEVTRSERRIPAKTARRRAIPVKSRHDTTLFNKLDQQQGKTKPRQRAMSIHKILLD